MVRFKTIYLWNVIGAALLFACESNAAWGQFGQTLTGKVAVALSSDGTILAERDDSDGFGVKIFQFTGCDWKLLGTSISAGSSSIPQAVALSSDGLTVAYGAPDANAGAGEVRLFSYSGTTDSWLPLGTGITGSGQAGFSVALSDDGKIVAIGAPSANSKAGEVRLFSYSGAAGTTTGSWQALGTGITGLAASGRAGSSVALSSDGKTVAIGAPNANSSAGLVRLFSYSGATGTTTGSWEPLGTGITGSGQAGSSVALSSDGRTVAFGAPYANSSAGQVRLFRYSEGSWVALGEVINGLAGDRAGFSVALSSDGRTVAYGAPNANSFAGQVRLFDYNGSNWVALGGVINGLANFNQAGYRVALSSDGKIVAYATPGANQIRTFVFFPNAANKVTAASYQANPQGQSKATDPSKTVNFKAGLNTYVFSRTETNEVLETSCQLAQENQSVRVLDAQSNIPLDVTLASLAGSSYDFTGMKGTLVDGTLSDDTLSNALGTQTGTVLGALIIPSGNYAGVYPASLSGAILQNVTVTGTTSGSSFTGTNITTGTISAGTFDIIFVELPTGTVFTVTAGDLAPTGTFTTTANMYGLLATGLSGTTEISNGEILLIGSVAGTFNYLGTDYAGGTLDLTAFDSVNATGTLSDANHFQASGSPTGNISDPIGISLALNNATFNVAIAGGTYAGTLFTGDSLNNATLSAGTLNAGLTGYDGATIAISTSCLPGFITGADFHITGGMSDIVIITSADIIGTTVAATNSLAFNGTDVVTGTFTDTASDVEAGTCS